MKKNLPLKTFAILFSIAILSSCSAHKYYTASGFDDKTAEHQTVAILPAEMIFTGIRPKDVTEEDIAKIEETESSNFQQFLYNNILQYANSKKYETTINFQDINTTQKKLEQNNISIRGSWKMDDKELAEKLGVDAVVRMRIRKQRYISDLASHGISYARQIIYSTGLGSKIPVPYVNNKTNDIVTSCNLVSNGQTLWNDYYTGVTNWNTPSDVVIENITENYGKHFPYKRKRK